MLLYGNSCDLLVNLSAICFLCSNGNRYITVICASLGNELELSVVDFINAQTFVRHILPSLAVLVLNLLNSICTAYCNRCFCTSVCIVIGGNTYGKFFCFTGFHRGIVKAGNSNLGRLPGRYSKGRACGCASNFIATCIHQLYGQGLLGCSSICIRYNTELLTGQVVNAQLIAGQVDPFFGITCSVLHLAARKVEFCLCGIGIALIGSDRKDITALASLDSVIGGAADGNSGRYSIFVHGIVSLVVCYIIRFRVNHSSSILCGIPSDEHFSIFCRLANTIDLFLCQMFLAPNLFNCFCVTTICKSTTIRVKNHIAIIVDTLIIIGK